ncbi:MAG: hypothetical protein ABI611_23335 [Solirubrobacteraceae bacterium]
MGTPEKPVSSWSMPPGGQASVDGSSGRQRATGAHEPRPTPVEWRWRLHPGERYERQPHPAGVCETLTFVRGRIVLGVGVGVGDAAHPLSTGATASFAWNVAHRYEGAWPRAVRSDQDRPPPKRTLNSSRRIAKRRAQVRTMGKERRRQETLPQFP